MIKLFLNIYDSDDASYAYVELNDTSIRRILQVIGQCKKIGAEEVRVKWPFFMVFINRTRLEEAVTRCWAPARVSQLLYTLSASFDGMPDSMKVLVRMHDKFELPSAPSRYSSHISELELVTFKDSVYWRATSYDGETLKTFEISELALEAMLSPTKLIRVNLSALTRQEYSVLVRVPANMDEHDAMDVVNEVWDQTDDDEFQDDSEFWERGEGCYADMAPTFDQDDKEGYVFTEAGELEKVN